jgi:hypothetical protein
MTRHRWSDIESALSTFDAPALRRELHAMIRGRFSTVDDLWGKVSAPPTLYLEWSKRVDDSARSLMRRLCPRWFEANDLRPTKDVNLVIQTQDEFAHALVGYAERQQQYLRALGEIYRTHALPMWSWTNEYQPQETSKAVRAMAGAVLQEFFTSSEDTGENWVEEFEQAVSWYFDTPEFDPNERGFQFPAGDEFHDWEKPTIGHQNRYLNRLAQAAAQERYERHYR